MLQEVLDRHSRMVHVAVSYPLLLMFSGDFSIYNVMAPIL